MAHRELSRAITSAKTVLFSCFSGRRAIFWSPRGEQGEVASNRNSQGFNLYSRCTLTQSKTSMGTALTQPTPVGSEISVTTLGTQKSSMPLEQHLWNKPQCPPSYRTTTDRQHNKHPTCPWPPSPKTQQLRYRISAKLGNARLGTWSSPSSWGCVCVHPARGIFNDNCFFSAASNVPGITQNDFAILTLGNLQVKGEGTTAQSSQY